jgi:hypothetical protein
MEPRTIPARSEHLSVAAAEKRKYPKSGRLLRMPHRRGIDPAMEVERAPFSKVASLKSSLLDLYANDFWFAPAFGYLPERAAQAFAFCMELHKNWLALLMPYARGTVASRFGSQAQTAEELAHYMDIAIGERFEVSSSSGSDIQLSADVLERSMDIAIGERKAA